MAYIRGLTVHVLCSLHLRWCTIMYLPVQIQIQQVMTDILYDGCTTETKTSSLLARRNTKLQKIIKPQLSVHESTEDYLFSYIFIFFIYIIILIVAHRLTCLTIFVSLSCSCLKKKKNHWKIFLDFIAHYKYDYVLDTMYRSVIYVNFIEYKHELKHWVIDPWPML